jgi:hypothetical protein
MKILEIVKAAFSGGSVVKDLGDIIDNVVTTKEEKINAISERLLKAQEHELKVYEAEAADRANARNLQIEMARAGKTDWMMIITGLVGLSSFIFIVYTLAFRELPEGNKELFIHLVGIVEGVVLTIFAFYYGTSKGSHDKNHLINK